MAETSFKKIEIGVISDTHGLLRPEVLESLKGCHYILHAGDVGNPEIIQQLKSIAPVFAVRGNTDWQPWATTLPHRESVEIETRWFYIVHRLEDLDLDPSVGFHAVIYGHSHMPERHVKEGVLYFNPGSAGPKRFKLPVSLGRITLMENRMESRILTLNN